MVVTPSLPAEMILVAKVPNASLENIAHRVKQLLLTDCIYNSPGAKHPLKGESAALPSTPPRGELSQLNLWSSHRRHTIHLQGTGSLNERVLNHGTARHPRP